MNANRSGLLHLPLLDTLDTRSRYLGIVLGLIMILAIALVQPALYPELPIATLYFIPVIVLAWVGGIPAGILGAFLAAGARYFVDAAGPPPSNPNVPALNLVISVVLYSVLAMLLARLRRALLYERELARTDSLTLLGNRRFFEHVAEVELSRSRRYGRPFALAYIDVDHFKDVNDRHGHAAGDALLRRIGQALVQALRTSDVVARLGGDEFAVLLPETPPDGAGIAMMKTQERITALVAETYPDITFSIGVVTYEAGQGALGDLLDFADRAMYTVKNAGRGSIRVERFEEGVRV